MGIPNLADYLEEGFVELGRNIEELQVHG
jgi:hypothetical protein